MLGEDRLDLAIVATFIDPRMQAPQKRILLDLGLCERNRNSTNRSNSPVRLMGVIIAVLFALSMAILPIAGAQAAGVMNHHDRIATEDVHEGHHHATAPDCEDADAASAPADDCSSTGHASHDDLSAGCCSMACHAFTVTFPVTLSEPTPFVRPMAIRSDQQVDGGLSARLERPPRTV